MKFGEISQNGWNFGEFLHFCEKGDFYEKWSPKSLKKHWFRWCFRSGAKKATEFSKKLKKSKNHRKS